MKKQQQTFALQAIRTTYHGPTNHRDARITAKAYAGKITIPWNDSKDVFQNHQSAAFALVEKFGWDANGDGRYIGGSLDNDGYVFVCAPREFTVSR